MDNRLQALSALYAQPGQRDRIQLRMERAVEQRVPKGLQAPIIRMATAAITWQSMQPSFRDRAPRRRNTFFGFIRRLMTLVGVTGAGVAVTAALPWYAAIAAAVPFILLQVGLLRHFAIGEGHMAAHGTAVTEKMIPAFLWRGRSDRVEQANAFVGRWATAAGLLTPHEIYRAKHFQHHELESFSITTDPDVADLKDKVGLIPGAPAPRQEHSYWLHLTSHWVHVRWFIERLIQNVFKADRAHRTAAFTVLTVLGAVLAISPLHTVMLMIVFPWVFGVQIAAQLQLPSLHVWMTSHEHMKDVEDSATRMQGRFPLTPPPESRFSIGNSEWHKWLAEVVFFDLPMRLAVLNTQLANHDAHHLGWYQDMKDEEWDDLPAIREIMKRELGDRYGIAQRELWGARTIVKAGLTAMALSVTDDSES